MSQQLQHCMNNIQCDSFANKLRRAKIEPQRSGFLNKREKTPTASHQNKNKTPPPQNCPKLKSTGSVIHKEVISDSNALVEVTVKTHNANQRSRSRSREPWNKILSYENTAFNYFDPLRTLHFLAKELQNKLLETLPNDTNLLQMVQDMQHALQRIPPEIASMVHLQQAGGETCSKKTSSTDVKHNTKLKTRSYQSPEKIMHVMKPVTFEKSCQTARYSHTAEAEKFQKHLEESSAKIESACKQMETVCTRLKSEKEELEIMLTAERETVKFLRKQIEDFENEKTDRSNAMIETLQAERDSLQSQIKKLKSQIELQPSQELKAVIQELRTQKADAEEQLQLLNHQVTLLNMEKEKYMAILSARDRQIKEIRSEMNQLQEVVNEQIAELQNGQCTSVPSSITNMTNTQSSWLLVTPKENKIKRNELEPEPIQEKDPVMRQLFPKDKLSSSREMQGDSSAESSEANKRKEKKKRNLKKRKPSPHQEKISGGDRLSPNAFMAHSDTHANIRNMFAEIKKQALLVTAPIMEAQQKTTNDVELYNNSGRSLPK